MDQPYDQVVMRSYRNEAGQMVQVALAWGRNQRQEVKIHRPDLCYPAQGFHIDHLSSHFFQKIKTPRGDPVLGKKMLVNSGRRYEVVAYWMRIGDVYSENAIDTRLKIFKDGLNGTMTDGILVRASVVTDSSDGFDAKVALLESFLEKMTGAVQGTAKELLVK
jgi:EpsI family protein